MPARGNPKPALTDGSSRARVAWRERWIQTSTACRRWLRRRQRPLQTEPASASPDHSSLPAVFTSLSEHSLTLKSIAGEIEKQFLTIGGQLEILPDSSQEFVRHSENLLALTTGRDGNESILAASFSRLQEPLDFIDRYRQTSASLRGQLQDTISGIERILQYESGLGRTVAPLKFIRTLFKVESSGLDHQVQTMFTALTEDISNLQEQVSETFGQKFQLLRDTRESIRKLVRNLDEQAREQDEVVASRKKALESALLDLQSQAQRNQQKNIELTQVSQGVAREVGRLVMGLQAQDIFSQKLAHVLSALDQMREQFRAYEHQDASNVSEQGRILHYFVQAARVERAQISAIGEDLHQCEENLSGALAAVQQLTNSLDQNSGDSNESSGDGAGVNGLVQVLVETMGKVRGLIETTLAGATAIHEAIRPLGGQTSNVTATMRQLSSHVRLIALNAQVQAAQIQNGTGLEVLAAATAQVSVDAGRISEDIASHLDRFGLELDRLVGVFTDLRHQAIAQQEQWNEQGPETEKKLHDFRAAALGELDSITRSKDRVREVAADMLKKLNLTSIASPSLRAAEDSLQQLAELGEALMNSPSYSKIRADLVSHFTNTYTMESERQVHDAALANSGSAAAPSQGTPAATTATPTGEASSNENVLLFADEPGPEAAPSSSAQASPSKPKEFGDNVDLF